MRMKTEIIETDTGKFNISIRLSGATSEKVVLKTKLIDTGEQALLLSSFTKSELKSIHNTIGLFLKQLKNEQGEG